jgi:hypothetical protein
MAFALHTGSDFLSRTMEQHIHALWLDGHIGMERDLPGGETVKHPKEPDPTWPGFELRGAIS